MHQQQNFSMMGGMPMYNPMTGQMMIPSKDAKEQQEKMAMTMGGPNLMMGGAPQNMTP
jgi:hypothetical protein